MRPGASISETVAHVEPSGMTAFPKMSVGIQRDAELTFGNWNEPYVGGCQELLDFGARFWNRQGVGAGQSRDRFPDGDSRSQAAVGACQRISKGITLCLVRQHGNDGRSVDKHQRSPLRSSKKDLSACLPVDGRVMIVR